MFASWGDEGPTLRGRMIGGLVREGVSIVILENPFYGVRRRAGQRGTSLQTVGDFVSMQGSTFDEARALVAWASRRIDAPVAVAGFSMGGHLAATVACAAASALPCAVLAPPLCPSEPFTAGPLSTCVDWEALGGETEQVRDRWTAIMDLFDVLDMPAPREPALTRVIACRSDGLVPPDHAVRIAERWRARLDTVEVGHISAALTQGKAMRRAIREVLGIPRRDAPPLLTGAVTHATAAIGRLRP
jgi:dienelactone hydrolase